MTEEYREACLAMLRACLRERRPEVIRAAATDMRMTEPNARRRRRELEQGGDGSP